MAVEKLVKLTYNKIFFEDLHILQNNIDSVKSLILNNQKLLTKKLDKVFFISDLAEKIKSEKISECIEQEQKYGEILMQNFEAIFTLYNWLDTMTSDSKDDNIDDAKIWIKEDILLNKLSDFLNVNHFTENSNDFSNIINHNHKEKINWKGTKTLLIYLFEELKSKGFFNPNISENSYIQNNFLHRGKYIENIKQSKSGKKQNKNRKPRNHNIIDSFFKSN